MAIKISDMKDNTLYMGDLHWKWVYIDRETNTMYQFFNRLHKYDLNHLSGEYTISYKSYRTVDKDMFKALYL